MARFGYTRLQSVVLLAFLVFAVNIGVFFQNWSAWTDNADHFDPLHLLVKQNTFFRHRLSEQSGVNESLVLERMESMLLSEQETCGWEKKAGLLDALQDQNRTNSIMTECHAPIAEGIKASSFSNPSTCSVVISVLEDVTFDARGLLVDVYRVLLDSAVSDVTIVLPRKYKVELQSDSDYGQRMLELSQNPESPIRLVFEDNLWKGWSKARPHSSGIIFLAHPGPASNLNRLWHAWQQHPSILHGVKKHECGRPDISTNWVFVIHANHWCFLNHALSQQLMASLTKDGSAMNSSQAWYTAVLWLSRLTDLNTGFDCDTMMHGETALSNLPEEVWDYLGFFDSSTT